MKLHAPFVQLPLAFDAGVLAAEVEALGEAPWKPHPQGFAGNSMLPLVAVGGDPGNPSFSGPMAPTAALLDCPYLAQVIASLGVVAGRSRLMRLSGQAEVTRHVDQGYYWAERVRVHVPIVTQPTVRFECGDQAINMAAGECWIFDTWRLHRVHNDDDRSRIHLVVDTVGGPAFWDLAMRGRTRRDANDGWQARKVVPEPGRIPDIAFERVNVPAVMSPWELKHLFGVLFDDALPHPRLRHVQLLTAQFARTWQGLWSQHGDGGDGLPAFREALKHYRAEVEPAAHGLQLGNGLAWYGAMERMIALYLLAADAPTQSGGA